MNTIARLSRAALLALPMTLATAASWADSNDLKPVEVMGQRDASLVRLDVQASCPSLVQTLRERLEPVAARIEASGEIQVDFLLDEAEPHHVRTVGGPVDMHTALKKAVRSVQCQSGSNSQQHYRFVAAFVPELSSGDAPRFALALR